MNATRLLLTVALILSISSVVAAKNPRGVAKVPPSTGTNVPCIVPVIENYRALDASRAKEVWAEPARPPKAGQAVAFSVSGDNMYSAHAERAIRYKTTHTNTHPAAWVKGGSHFRAPAAGLYLFTVSFTSEQHPRSDGDDVYVVIRKNGQAKGFAFVGEVGQRDDTKAGNPLRKTGSYTVALPLVRGDVVHTGVVDDVKRRRWIRFFNFTGVLIQPAMREARKAQKATVKQERTASK